MIYKTFIRVSIFTLFIASFIRPTLKADQFLLIRSNSLVLDASIFSPPLGFRSGIKYIPRYTYDNQGNLIENTDYGIQNPDLKYFSNCFGIDRRYLLHAGEDLYRNDGSSSSGDEVTAVADGIVFNYDSSWDYPGEAIILQHHLSTGEYIYSVYMHIIDVPPEIAIGQPVSRGQRIGAVLQQFYDGNYPNYHGADDSHLHFEMRYFASAANIYSDHPSCNMGDAAGRGYTFPSYPPDTYPNSSQHYTDPGTFIRSRAGTFLPLIQRANCINGQQLLANRGFESGRVSWIEESQPGYHVITNYLLPTPAHTGDWAAWFGGRNNASERIYQTFTVMPGTTGVNLIYYFWMRTDEILSLSYDKLYVRLRDSNNNLLDTIDYLDNNSYEYSWENRSIPISNLAAYQGQTLRLSFEGTTDSSYVTNFLIDDVSLTAICSEGPFPQFAQELVTPINPPQATPTGVNPIKPIAPTPTSTQTPIPYP